jgi:hypothetical protein
MKNYGAGWNMPGCLPENELAGFETFEEAKNYIILELFRYMHELYDAGELDDAEVEQVEIEINLLKKLEYDFVFKLGRYHFWVHLLY